AAPAVADGLKAVEYAITVGCTLKDHMETAVLSPKIAAAMAKALSNLEYATVAAEQYIEALKALDRANVLTNNICAHMDTVTEDNEAADTAHVLVRLNSAITPAEVNCVHTPTQPSLIAGSLDTLYEATTCAQNHISISEALDRIADLIVAFEEHEGPSASCEMSGNDKVIDTINRAASHCGEYFEAASVGAFMEDSGDIFEKAQVAVARGESHL
ncbi:hypothetical protein H4S07_006407, partial [Coemansia furcata]